MMISYISPIFVSNPVLHSESTQYLWYFVSIVNLAKLFIPKAERFEYFFVSANLCSVNGKGKTFCI